MHLPNHSRNNRHTTSTHHFTYDTCPYVQCSVWVQEATCITYYHIIHWFIQIAAGEQANCGGYVLTYCYKKQCNSNPTPTELPSATARVKSHCHHHHHHHPHHRCCCCQASTASTTSARKQAFGLLLQRRKKACATASSQAAAAAVPTYALDHSRSAPWKTTSADMSRRQQLQLPPGLPHTSNEPVPLCHPCGHSSNVAGALAAAAGAAGSCIKPPTADMHCVSRVRQQPNQTMLRAKSAVVYSSNCASLHKHLVHQHSHGHACGMHRRLNPTPG